MPLFQAACYIPFAGTALRRSTRGATLPSIRRGAGNRTSPPPRPSAASILRHPHSFPTPACMGSGIRAGARSIHQQKFVPKTRLQVVPPRPSCQCCSSPYVQLLAPPSLPWGLSKSLNFLAHLAVGSPAKESLCRLNHLPVQLHNVNLEPCELDGTAGVLPAARYVSRCMSSRGGQGGCMRREEGRNDREGIGREREREREREAGSQRRGVVV